MKHSIKKLFREIGCSMWARETASKLEALKLKASMMTVDEELRLLKDLMISHVIYVNYLKENEHSPQWRIEEALKSADLIIEYVNERYTVINTVRQPYGQQINLGF